MHVLIGGGRLGRGALVGTTSQSAQRSATKSRGTAMPNQYAYVGSSSTFGAKGRSSGLAFSLKAMASTRKARASLLEAFLQKYVH